MPSLFGTTNQHGVPVAYEFVYNGGTSLWGTNNLHSLSPLSNSAETFDGAYQISNLQAEFVDTDGSIWGSLGHGTSCLYKSFVFTAYVGGTMDHVGYSPNATRFERQNLVNSATVRLHTGKIINVGRRDRLVRIESQSNMRQLGLLTWMFPYKSNSQVGTNFGSFYFLSGNIATNSSGSENSVMKFNESDDGLSYSVFAAIATTALTDIHINAAYVRDTTRGTETTRQGTGFYFLGTGFFNNFRTVELQATYLGTFQGTIQSHQEALSFGFANVSSADSAFTGGSYAIGKTRLTAKEGLDGSHFIFRQGYLPVQGNPATIFKELICGALVWPYFSSSDIDTTSYAEFNSFTAFMAHRSILGPDGDSPVEVLKNVLNGLSCLFSVTETNTFKPTVYGPKNLTVSLPSLGSHDVINSSVESNIEDFYNRVEIEYGYLPEKGSYTRRYATSLSSWSITDDRTLNIKSRWVYNENEIKVLGDRLLQRYQYGVPRFSMDLPMGRLGISIGSLYQVTDADCVMSGKTVQVLETNKDVCDDRKVEISGIDADILFKQRGYAFWGTGGTLPGDAGNSDSSAIWGTTDGGTWYAPAGNGTASGINVTVFGSIFKWF